MGYALFFGCLLMAFSPGLAVFVMIIAKNPRLVILTIGSSFFWLLSMLIAALWWLAIPPLRETFAWILFSSVIIQEGFRFIFYALYGKAEKGFANAGQTKKLTTHPDNFLVALAFGLGIGLSHCAITYLSILFESTGPGTYYLDTCPQVSAHILGALHSLAFVLLHMAWAVITLDGWKQAEIVNKKGIGVAKLLAVVVLHLISSFLTMVNYLNCIAGVFVLYVVVAIAIAFAWKLTVSSPFMVSKTTVLRFQDD